MKTIFLHIGQPRSGSTFLQTKNKKKLKLLTMNLTIL